MFFLPRAQLCRDRLNGEYPFSIAVRGVDAAGNALEARFPLEAVITGGQENGEVPQLLLMDFRAGDGAWIEAGEEATLSLTLVNQSATRAVENIAIVFAESTGGLFPARSDTVRVSRLAAGESALVEIPIRAAMDAEPRAHSVEIRAQGAYGAGEDTSVAEKFTVDVRQSVRFAHSEAALPVRVTQGDVSSFTITLMNMGKSPLSNALLTFDVPGLASGGSVLAGDLAPGESKDATANFRVSSDEALVGPVSGTVTLSYEDAYGEYYETSLPLSTTIEKKAPLAAASADEEEEAAPFPYLPWSLFAAALIALIVLQTLARRRIRALEERGAQPLRPWASRLECRGGRLPGPFTRSTPLSQRLHRRTRRQALSIARLAFRALRARRAAAWRAEPFHRLPHERRYGALRALAACRALRGGSCVLRAKCSCRRANRRGTPLRGVRRRLFNAGNAEGGTRAIL